MRAVAAGAGVLVMVSAGPLFAHDGRPLAPHDVWGAWTFDAAIVIPLVVVAILYTIGAIALAERASPYGRRVRRRRTAAFILGWSVLAASLVSPLHAMGEVLFSAHMIQHELLVAVAAPLLVMSRPFVRAVWALPDRARHLVVTFSRLRSVHRTWELLCHPTIAWALHAAALWLWHLPGLYERTLGSDLAHGVQHASFLGTALLFWWSLVRVRVRRGIGVVSLFTTTVHTGALGALIALAPSPWYAKYGETSAAWGLTALEDQQLAGIIMWMPAALVYTAAALWLASGWLAQPRHRDVAVSRATLGSLLALTWLIAGCTDRLEEGGNMLGGNAERGRAAVRRYGCIACHTIPRMEGDVPSVGPSLAGFGGRAYIAGVLPNTPVNLITWISDPPGVDSLTAMPNLGVTARDAVDIAEYLYTLR